ncbi:DUF1445 domain-containing protein [Pseudonocardia sp. MCCB 268]|nr:DUF1445 domain-containing protein [Pseudonocardia cytotoxica]
MSPGTGRVRRGHPEGDIRTDLLRIPRVRARGSWSRRRRTSCSTGAQTCRLPLPAAASPSRTLFAAGVPVRHLAQGTNVPDVPDHEALPPRRADVRAVGRRCARSAEPVDTAVAVTARYPAVHGAPVHTRQPAALGDRRPDRPDLRRPGPDGRGRGAGVLACGHPAAAVLSPGCRWRSPTSSARCSSPTPPGHRPPDLSHDRGHDERPARLARGRHRSDAVW